MSKEWPDIPALLAEARQCHQARGWSKDPLVNKLENLANRLAGALETMHDLYRQADTSAVNLIAEKDELQARIRAAKEQAWDEGFETAWRLGTVGDVDPTPNPYQEEP